MGAVLVLALVAALFGSSLLREEPLRVVIVGDSVSYDAEPGIRAALEATGDVLVETRVVGQR